MDARYELRVQTADLILDFRDTFAAGRAGPNVRPMPLEAVRLRFVARIANGAAVALEPPLELVTARNTSGYYLFFGAVRLPDGEVGRGLLPPGEYDVRVESFLYRPEVVRVTLPTRGAVEVDLRPGQSYPFPQAGPLRLAFPAAGCPEPRVRGRAGTTLLRGTVFNRAGAPIPGVTVTALPNGPSDITGPAGDWLLVLPPNAAGADWPTGPITVRFAYPAGAGAAGAPAPAPFDVTDVCVVRGYDMGLLQTALRGRVVNADGRPAAGVTVELTARDANGGELFQVGDPPVTDRNGNWTRYFDPGQPGTNAATFVLTVPGADGQPRTETVPVIHRATAVAPAIRR